MNNTKLVSSAIVLVMLFFCLTGCFFQSKVKDYEQPFSLGEGMTYKSFVFQVYRPTHTPYPIKINDRYAYARDTHGTHSEQCTEAVFDFAKPITEDLGAVKMGNKWGYVQVTPHEGEGYRFVIEPQFESAEPFREGLAAVRLNQQYGYIRSNGDFVIDPQYRSAHYFSGGLAAVETDGGWFFIDQKGKAAIEGPYECAESFTIFHQSEDNESKVDTKRSLAPVKINERWGYINLEGQIAIEPIYEDAWAFEPDGKAAVKIKNKWKYLNTNGEVIGSIH